MWVLLSFGAFSVFFLFLYFLQKHCCVLEIRFSTYISIDILVDISIDISIDNVIDMSIDILTDEEEGGGRGKEGSLSVFHVANAILTRILNACS